MTTYVPSSAIQSMRDIAKRRLVEATEVEDQAAPIDADEDLYSQAAKWKKYQKVVTVTADLKGSTKLVADGMWVKSTAAIYDAAIEPMARMFDAFDCDFVDVQGDGGFALFTGDLAAERAVCAAISIQTFSKEHLVPLIEDKYRSATKKPKTGFKLGVATSDVLARKVGIPRTDHQAPIWAGRAVNYAAKAAQQADLHRILVTRQIGDVIQGNDYLAYSCGCVDGRAKGSFSSLWSPEQIDHVDSASAEGLVLESTWCSNCGDDFCAAVLRGETRRTETKPLRAQATRARMSA